MNMFLRIYLDFVKNNKVLYVQTLYALNYRHIFSYYI